MSASSRCTSLKISAVAFVLGLLGASACGMPLNSAGLGCGPSAKEEAAKNQPKPITCDPNTTIDDGIRCIPK